MAPGHPAAVPIRWALMATLSVLGAGAGSAVTGCGREPVEPSSLPNIVLIVADDLGWSEVGSYGNAAVRTPAIDRLAAEGVLFERAYSVTPSCSASRAALLTGRYPHTNGVISLLQWHTRAHRKRHAMRALRTHRHSLNRGEIILPQDLKKLGYHTAIIGKWHVSIEKAESWGFDQRLQMADRRSEALEAPFFLYYNPTHTHQPFRSDPEHPYDPSEVVLPPYFNENRELRYDLAEYYSAISSMDREIGRILEWLDRENLADDTLVVFTSDNGPPYARAKATLYEWGVREPLIFRHPGAFEGGRRTAALASTLDIYPTLLDLIGRPIPDRRQGASLRPYLDDPSAAGREALFLESNYHVFYTPGRAVRSGRWKYIRNFNVDAPFYTQLEAVGLMLLKHPLPVPPRTREELYDLETDPLEGDNLAADPAHAAVLASMRSRLDAWMQQTDDDPRREFAIEPRRAESWEGGWFGPHVSPAPNRRETWADYRQRIREARRKPAPPRAAAD
ncbi:MAG: sulfatase [Myxococcota bacterium]